MPKYKHGSGSVYQRGKTWWITYYVNGRQVGESAKTKDKTEARRVLRTKIGQLAEGRYAGPEAERVTFDDLALGILNDYRINGRKTISDVKIRLTKHLQPFFGDRKAHKITTVEVEEYVAARQTDGAANGTINRELAALKRAFNIACQAGRIHRKPYVPMLQEDNARQGFFEQHEFEQLLPNLPEHLKAPATFAYYTGWRMQSEVLRLRWDQVDLAVGTVRLEVRTTKNKDGRLIYLTTELYALLSGLWQQRQATLSQCPFVFPYRGAGFNSYKRSWVHACKKAGLTGKVAHDFRRTAVRNMVRAGIPERVAMQMAGHKTRSVFDRYHIVSDGDLKEAAGRLDRAFSPQTMTTPFLEGEQGYVSH